MSPNASYTHLGLPKRHCANLQPLTTVLPNNNSKRFAKTPNQIKQANLNNFNDEKKAKLLNVGKFKASVYTQESKYGYHIISLTYKANRLGLTKLRSLANYASNISGSDIRIRKGIFANDQLYTLHENLLKHEGLFRGSYVLTDASIRPHSAHPLSNSTSHLASIRLNENSSTPKK